MEWHSAFRLPDGLDERTQRFCQILRDADKIDILRVNVETPMEEIYNVTTAQLRQSPVTPAVLDAFYEHHCVLHSLKNGPADNAVGHASLVFELCYPKAADRRRAGVALAAAGLQNRQPRHRTGVEKITAEMKRWLKANGC